MVNKLHTFTRDLISVDNALDLAAQVITWHTSTATWNAARQTLF